MAVKPRRLTRQKNDCAMFCRRHEVNVLDLRSISSCDGRSANAYDSPSLFFGKPTRSFCRVSGEIWVRLR